MYTKCRVYSAGVMEYKSTGPEQSIHAAGLVSSRHGLPLFKHLNVFLGIEKPKNFIFGRI